MDNIAKFHKNGFVTVEESNLLENNIFFKKKQFINVLNNFDQIIPLYNNFFFQKKLNKKNHNNFEYYDLHEGSEFKIPDINRPYSKKLEDINIFGSPLNYRLTRGRGPVTIPPKNLMNYLYGYRAVLGEQLFNNYLINNVIENINILSFIAKIYDSSVNDIEFINGSLASSYPGSTGEEGFFHIDTPGFTNDSFSDDIFAVNVMIYLTDVNESLAPVRVIPESHTQYNMINNHVAKSHKSNASKNNIPQALSLWEELLPNNLINQKKIIGKAGTITFMNSSLLHSATSNFDEKLERKVIILNFSLKKLNLKKRNNYTADLTEKFISKFKNKELVSFAFSKDNNIVVNKRKISISKILKKVDFILKDFTLKIENIYNYKIRKPFLSILTKEKKYLNLGASTGWTEPGFLSLDYYNSGADIECDLNIKSKLPIEDNYLKGVYTSNVIEHLQESACIFWFQEVYRMMKKDGVFRVTAPDMELVFKAYEEKNILFFEWKKNNHIHQFDSWIRWITRMFAEPIVDQYSDKELRELFKNKNLTEYLDFLSDKVDKIDDNNFLNPNIHKSWWSGKKVKKILQDIGFRDVKIVKRRESKSSVFRKKIFNNTRVSICFFVEAIK